MQFLSFSREELLNIILISLALSLFFFFSPLISLGILYILFFVLMLLLVRLAVFKIVGYWNGFSVTIELSYFNRYGFKSYERITYYLDNKVGGDKKKSKGIPMIIISLIIYILTVGLIIYPNLWRFRIKDIPYRIVGLRRKPETIPFVKTTYYRYSIALFMSLAVYSIIALLLSHLPKSKDLLFIMFYIAFWNLVPIPVSEGFELFLWNKFLWVFSIFMLLVTLLIVLVINNLLLQCFLLMISFVTLFFWLVWRVKK